MALVDYSDSEEDLSVLQLKKRRKLSHGREDNVSSLPPLPAAFRDLYSSAVRTSTHDDPSLHAGRKRITPHVVGNWPAHVYLEWCPQSKEYESLCNVVEDIRKSFVESPEFQSGGIEAKNAVHSLLKNDLGVQLPLHVSLSRPLALKTEQKDAFLQQLRATLASTYIRCFSAKPLNLVWHPNEDSTRWFLVLRLQRPIGDELRKLLKFCNDIASYFDQPVLYEDDTKSDNPNKSDALGTPHDNFHISIAWSLHPHGAEAYDTADRLQQDVKPALRDSFVKLHIPFTELKVRIGQDVSSFLLQKPRTIVPAGATSEV